MAEPAKCPCCGAPIADSALLIDWDGGLVVGNGQVAALTRQEFALFTELWAARPRVLSKAQLLAATEPDVGFDDREIKIVDVFICKARKKLRPVGIAISTVWGTGYRILVEQGEAS